MRRFILLMASTAIFLVSFVGLAQGQDMKNFGKCPVIYGYQGSYNFAKDSKASTGIKNLKEIDPNVQKVIEDQLVERVGSIFAKRLNLRYGYAKDFDQSGGLMASDSQRIDAYDMVFEFSNKDKGLSSFRFKVVTDASGGLIEKLALPDISSDPGKGLLVSCEDARKTAAKNGFPFDRTSIYFVYDWDSKSFVWMLSDNKAVEPDLPLGLEGKGTYRKMLIEAHTGKVLKIYKETIVL